MQERTLRARAARTTPEALDYLATARGGWRAVSVSSGDRCGMSAHRGVLHPDEYVDTEALRAAVEPRLGFTYDEVKSVYRRGRLSAERLQLRERIDARLLMISRGGGNMTVLGRALGFKATGRNMPTAMEHALARARSAVLLAFCAWHEDVPADASGTICPECAAAYV